jgi:gamma-glutamyltranspeptidase/glutathione hydrolase
MLSRGAYAVSWGLWLTIGWGSVAVAAGFQQPAAHGIVATVNPLATDAAVETLRNGGNAIDAAVVAALILGVVDGFNSGIGGGCFMLVRLHDGTILAIDGRETAPAGATRDMFVRNNKVVPELSQTGGLAVGVPGALAAYDYAVRHFGKLRLATHLARAADIAQRGFTLDRQYANHLRSEFAELARFTGSRLIFLDAHGQPWPEGHTLVQSDLARTYRAIAKDGIEWFYRGAFAQRTEKWMTENGGIIKAADFARYESKLRQPIRTRYRGLEVIGFPPPSSGGVHVAQILNILEHFDLKKMGPNSADLVHVIAEAMKLAFADRAFWLGDPDFVHVPSGLVSTNYSQALAKRIRMDTVEDVRTHGNPPGAGQNFFGKHTTHFTTADAEGNWVACTATINTTFGSKVTIPGTGVVLNNEMDDFSAQPGATNFFGLVGAEANAVAAKKRPLSSMSPTFVLRDGQPILAVGAAGGPTIISQSVLAIVYSVDFGMDVEEALSQPRFHHQWRPDELKVESRLDKRVVQELRKRGHKIVFEEQIGVAQAIAKSGGNRGFLGAHDPRVNGKAAGW